MNKKIIALMMALVLILGAAIGGTLAWLTAKTDPVTNTFTTSDIEITLDETKPEGKTAQIIPGYTIDKDPLITVLADSEKCYLFVKVAEGNWPAITEEDGKTRKIDYKVLDAWTKLTGVEGVTDVYYRVVEKSDDGQGFKVLVDDKVTVSPTLTKEEMAAITTSPTLTFTAYASQFNSSNNVEFSAAEAWANVPKA